MTSEELETTIREQLSRVVANALASGVPSAGMFNRATAEILNAARAYAFTMHVSVHYKRPLSNRSACGRGFGGVTDPREVTCAGCQRTRGYRAALQEAS